MLAKLIAFYTIVYMKNNVFEWILMNSMYLFEENTVFDNFFNKVIKL